MTYQQPEFKLAFLHPKYWLVWIGFAFLALLVTILPYRALLYLGGLLGRTAPKLAKSRVNIIHRNLELAFPDMPESERQLIATENFKNTGFALFEMGIAWFWPNWRIKKHIIFNNSEELLALEQQGRGALVVCVHSLNLEITARAFSLFAPSYCVYRPHNNPVYDYIQYWGRSHFGNQMIDRKDVRGMLKVLRSGGRLWYLPDHDYGFNNSVFVPFFGVENAATTAAAGVFVNASKCALIAASNVRKGEIYTLEMDKDISADIPRKDAEGAARIMNQAIEQVINRCLAQWMWMHRRFKTMPDNLNRGSRYKN